MTDLRPPLLFAATLIVSAGVAQAGQPLLTDEASVVPPKTCQLEAWMQSTGDGREYWAQPACNFGGSVEFAVGAARLHPDGGDHASAIQLQVKTVLIPRDEGAWSFGVVAAANRDTGAPHGSSAFQAFDARALASWYPRDELEIDLNLGAANVYGTGTFALAGAAVQYAVVPNLQLLAEVYRDEPGRGKYQVGLRYALTPERFEAYASYGNRLGSSFDQWSVTVGIRMQTSAFLP